MVNGTGDRIRSVRERMSGAASASGRDPGDVTLVAVTKTRTLQEIEDALLS